MTPNAGRVRRSRSIRRSPTRTTTLLRHCPPGGRDDAAVASYRRAIALAPGNALFHFNLGVALQPLQADSREVEACYRQALALDPRFAPAMSNLGVLYLRERRLDEAFGLLTRAQAASPDDPQIMTSLGLVLQKRKQYGGGHGLVPPGH